MTNGKNDINEKTYDVLNVTKNIYTSQKLDSEKTTAMLTIESSTLSSINKILAKLLFCVNYKNIVYNKDLNCYELIINDKKYSFFRFNDYFDLSNDLQNELKSFRRYKKCHSSSIDILIGLGEELNLKIITGYYYSYDMSCLHSIIEFEHTNSNKYIIDYTKNLIISKEYYYELTNFKELSSITYDDFIENFKYMNQSKVADIAIWLLFYKELARDFKKNKFLFENDSETKKLLRKLKN